MGRFLPVVSTPRTDFEKVQEDEMKHQGVVT